MTASQSTEWTTTQLAFFSFVIASGMTNLAHGTRPHSADNLCRWIRASNKEQEKYYDKTI